MDTKRIGDISEAEIIVALLKLGKTVLKPIGDNNRYDLVIEEDGNFFRVQCKTGKMVNGSIRVAVKSIYLSSKGPVIKNYKGQVEFFAVYCPQIDKVYLVPEEEVGVNQISLRVEATKQNHPKIRWAKQYEIGELPEPGRTGAVANRLG